MSATKRAGISLPWAGSAKGRRPAEPVIPYLEGSTVALDALAISLQQVLAPVTPAARFRAELARDLSAVARQKVSPQIILRRPPKYRRSILIGAAVSSAVSVAGIIAYIWRQHSHGVAGRTA